MTSSAELHRCLRRVARGELEHYDRLLALLARALLFVPVRSTDESGREAAERLRIPTFDRAKTKVLPVFTTEEALIVWSADYQCIALLGADVALAAPEGVWLVVNPGQLTEVELSPSEVAKMARIDTQPKALDEPRRSQSGFITAPSEFPQRPPIPHPSSVDLEAVLTDLRKLLSSYEEVSEGFFELIGGAYSCAILGVLRRKMDSERRFLMMAAIAEISRQHFGIAGGIEVYDDLHVPRSKSWELFQALAPFYSGKQQAAEAPLLSSKIEKVSEPRVARKPEGAKQASEGSSVLRLGSHRAGKET